MVSGELLTKIKGAKIGTSYKSDHSLISVELETEIIDKGKPFWKFNNSLLRDKQYVEVVKKIIDELERQYTTINEQNEKQQNAGENKKIINDQLFFEMILLEIRGKTISYASYKKNKERKEEKTLLEEISRLENNLCDDNLELLENKKNAVTGNQIIKSPRYGS